MRITDYDQFDLDYRTVYDCASHGCDDEGICRCREIVDKSVRGVDIPKIREYLPDGGDPLSNYCIERVACHLGFYDKDNWEIESSGNYYGEEVDAVNLYESIQKDFDEKTYELLGLRTDSEKIEFILKLEYGFLSEVVKDKEWSLATIDKKDIVLGNLDYSMRVNDKRVKGYKNCIGPIGVVVKTGKKLFKLIDGYHRYAANNENKVQVILGE